MDKFWLGVRNGMDGETQSTKLGAESRSHLVETALTAYFSGRDAISA